MAADVFMRPGRFSAAAAAALPSFSLRGAAAMAAAEEEDSSSSDDSEEGDPPQQPPRPQQQQQRRGRPAGSRQARRSPQIIHSGHFMVSSPHSEHPPKKGYDFDTVNEQTCQTYRFGAAAAKRGAAPEGRAGRGGGGGVGGGGGGPGEAAAGAGGGGGEAGGRLSIDASLTKLFECMTLAYSGKLVSPKWKNFKGLKLQCRDKIRLNNAIWRAWYIQYLEKRKNPVCHFVTPLDGSVEVDEHRRPEAIATEGKYWKRRIEIVIREYHKWRTYFKKRLQKHKDEDLSSLARDDDAFLWHKKAYGRETPVPMELDCLFNTDMLMSELPDTLFSTISSHQAVSWLNPREIAHLGNADMIQPGLSPLQPNCMDTFELFHEFFSSNRPNNYPAAIPATPAVDPALAGTCSHPSQTSGLSSDPLPVNLGEGLIGAPVPGPIISTVTDMGADPCLGLRSGGSFLQPPGFNSEPPLSSQAPFLSPYQNVVPLLQPGALPLPQQQVPLNAGMTSQMPIFAPAETPKFGLSKSSVITHTASATPTHNVPATTFSHSQAGLLATQQPGGGMPCSLTFHTTIPQGQPLLQPSATFALPLTSAGTRPKKPQKIVPAPKPETVSLAFIAPAAFQGQPSTMIVAPVPLKSEGVLAPRMSQPNVVIAPSGMARTPRAPEFRSGILLSPGQQSPSPQPSQAAVPHIFSPGSIQDVLVKGEKAPPHKTCSQISTPSPSRDCQPSPCPSEQSLSPQSPQNCSGKPTNPQVTVYKTRRMKHISAEQKRRFNIKIGFSTLNNLVSANSKSISHALTLQKTVEYIAKLQQERSQMQEEAKRLREEIEELNTTIISCQQQLPVTGVPITRQRFDQMRSMFEEYIRNRTLQNWKFWIFSIIINPLFETFNGMVSTTSLEELHQTALAWVDQHCSLPVLRPMVLNTLRHLSQTTSILSDPSRLPEQATKAVSKINKTAGQT